MTPGDQYLSCTLHLSVPLVYPSSRCVSWSLDWNVFGARQSKIKAKSTKRAGKPRRGAAAIEGTPNFVRKKKYGGVELGQDSQCASKKYFWQQASPVPYVRLSKHAYRKMGNEVGSGFPSGSF